MTDIFPGKLGLVQRVLPVYRAPFFETLAQRCAGGLQIFAGEPLPGEGIAPARELTRARLTRARNLNFLSPASPAYLCFQRGLLTWLEENDPAALIVEANPRYLSTPAALRWMKSRRRPVLGWGLGPPAGPWGFVRNLDGLIAYSARGAARYIAGGFPAEKVFIAPNAASPAPAFELPVRGAEFSSRRLAAVTGIESLLTAHEPPRPVLLFVGRIQPRKRLPALLAACAGLPAALRPALLIVGDGPALNDLKKNAPPWAHFPGALRGAALEACFRAADLFVLPGTGGLAVQEAMSFGLPVIVAQGDGTQDDLVRPANGWQIPPGDDAALAETLREALSDLPRLRRMGAESYRIVKEEINLEQMAAKFVQALAV
ncbi:MAG: hypothetical protein Fur0035_05260 [Anaerolineales bacterium]